MNYEERRPPAALAPWIECVWTLRGSGGGPDPVLPDGRNEIVLNYGDRFRRHGNGTVERQARALFVGPMREAVVLEPEGAIDIVGIRLRPAVAGGLLRMSMAELGEGIPALDDAAPRFASLFERAGNAGDRVGATLSALGPLLNGAALPDPRLVRAVRSLEDASGDLAIDRAARVAAWSPRQLQRRFLHDVGLGPKTFARIVRIQAAARAAPRAARMGWAHVAVACGFFDQAHLIREFRAIAGRTPAAFFETNHPIGSLFTQA